MENKKESKHVAVALSFDGNSTPRVSAVGQNKTADTMRRIARRYGVPVKKNTRLANNLSTVEENELVPEDLFYDVAELFCDLDD